MEDSVRWMKIIALLLFASSRSGWLGRNPVAPSTTSLRIEDVNFATRTISIHGGKGQEDGVGFFGAEVARILRVWLARRVPAGIEDYVFVDRTGRSLTRHHATHILHRLSVRAGLPRKVGPHALRQSATSPAPPFRTHLSRACRGHCPHLASSASSTAGTRPCQFPRLCFLTAGRRPWPSPKARAVPRR